MLSDEKQNDIITNLRANKYQPDFFIKCLTSMLYEREERPERPLFVSWDLVNYCNLNCFFCSANALRRIDSNSPDIKNYEKILKRLVEIKPLYVSLLGGEPTLHPYWLEIVSTLNKAGIFVELISNGVCIDEGSAKILSELNQHLLRVKISLDSYIPEHNDKQRGKNSFSLAINALENFNTYPIKNLRVQMVITPFNVNDIFHTYKFLHNYNVSSFGATNILPTGRANHFKKSLDEDLVIEEFSKCLVYYNEMKKIRIEKIGIGYEKQRQFIECLDDTDANSERMFKVKCYAGFGRMNIDQNGDIYPCDYLKFEEFKVGNIIDDSFSSIWNSEVFKMLVAMKRSDKIGCSTCPVKNCNTGCMGLAYEKFGTINIYDPNCQFIKR